jgi:hypothetical protein
MGDSYAGHCCDFIAVMALADYGKANTFSMEDLNNDECTYETDFRSDQSHRHFIFRTDDFQTCIWCSMDNEVLLEYLVDEVDMNIMMEEWEIYFFYNSIAGIWIVHGTSGN